MKKDNKIKKESYLVYSILFATILVLAGITITYAFLQVEPTYSSTTGNVTALMECLDISYSETTFDLDYNYPISDDFALSNNNITPVTVQVKNNCTSNNTAIDYTLALTSLSNSSGYISDNKIRINAKRKLGSESETTVVNTDYLSNLTELNSGNAYTYLTQDLDNRPSVSPYANRTSYIIDSNSIANGATNTYKVYLWVDYYEGDTTHTGLNDNSTEGQNFAAAISLVVNPIYNEDYIKPNYLSDTIMALESKGQVVHEEFSYDLVELKNLTKLAADSTEYTSVTPDDTYGFYADATNDTWQSGNTYFGDTTSSIEFVPKETAGYQLCYNMYTEYDFDYGIIYVDDIEIYNAYGKGMDDSTTYTCVTLGILSNSNTIRVTYSKDGSVDSGNDQFIFYINKGTTSTQTVNVDAGYRYEGSNVDNYLLFNNEEIWRIVGVQEGSTIGLEEGKYYTKIVNTNSYNYTAYDSYCYSGDYSCGVHGNYLYDYASNFDEIAYNMVVSPDWYYAPYGANTPVENDAYIAERNDMSYQLNDITGLVSLSDILYANGWFNDFGDYFWTITPYTDEYSAWYYEYDNITYTSGDSEYNIYPSVYLNYDVIIDDGDGSSGNPFIITLEE